MSNHAISASLPVIDIAPWLDPHGTKNPGRLSVSAALHNACMEYGFFYLNISGYINADEAEEVLQLGREFFHLSQEEKDRYALMNNDHARGYARLKENVTNGKADNHEGLDIYRPVDSPDKTKIMWGENPWPKNPSALRSKYEAWIDKMKVLGMIVMEAMAMGLGMTQEEWSELKAKVNDSFWVMRIIGYPPLPDDHDGFSCGAHRDYGCLTFLHSDSTKEALQVFLPGKSVPTPRDASINIAELPREQGDIEGRWITANPIPGCVVCNIGEMWEVWTNGLYKSTLHRVVHRGTNYRVSMPFFYEPNFNARVAPLAAALRIQANSPSKEEQAARQYTPVIYGEFLTKKVSGNFSGEGKYGV